MQADEARAHVPAEDKKPAAPGRDLHQRRAASSRIIAVVARIGYATHGVRAHDEGRAGKQFGFRDKRRRAREPDHGPGTELVHATLHLLIIDRRLVRVENRDLELDALAQVLFGSAGHAAVALVQRMEGARENDMVLDPVVRGGRTDPNHVALAQQ